GLVAGAVIAPTVASLASSPVARAALALAALFGAAALGMSLGWTLGRRIRPTEWRVVRGGFDSVAGVLVSVAIVLLVVWFVAYNLVSGPVPAVSRAIQSSAIVRGLEES